MSTLHPPPYGLRVQLETEILMLLERLHRPASSPQLRHSSAGAASNEASSVAGGPSPLRLQRKHRLPSRESSVASYVATVARVSTAGLPGG